MGKTVNTEKTVNVANSEKIAKTKILRNIETNIADKTAKRVSNSVMTEAILHREMLQKLILKLERELNGLPEGSLVRKTINGKTYLYHCTRVKGKKSPVQKSIPKNDIEFANALKRRRFIEKCLPQLKNNIKVIELFLRNYNPFDAAFISQKLSNAYKDLPRKCYLDIEGRGYITDWLKEDYEKYELYPENLIHETSAGFFVRSKSEVIIIEILLLYNIPFRYEAAVRLGDVVYFPDLTILRPKDGRILYWEHFGMMHDQEYAAAMKKKMTTYMAHDIIPWSRLITTYDDQNGSISAQTIKNIIEAFIM